jgi:hypothetical protein
MAGTATSTVTSRKGRGIVRVDIDLVCASGAVSAQSIGSFFGRLVGVLTDGTAGAGATMNTAADILITDAATGAPILSDLTFATSDFYRPTAVVVDSAGAAITPATTANDLNRDIFVAGKLNIAIVGATTTDTGRLTLIFAEAV